MLHSSLYIHNHVAFFSLHLFIINIVTAFQSHILGDAGEGSADPRVSSVG